MKCPNSKLGNKICRQPTCMEGISLKPIQPQGFFSLFFPFANAVSDTKLIGSLHHRLVDQM